LKLIIRVIKSRRMGWAGYIARMEKIRNKNYILVGKPGENIPARRVRRSCKDNRRIDLRGKWWEFIDWMHLAQDNDKCEHDNELLGSIKGGEFCN